MPESPYLESRPIHFAHFLSSQNTDCISLLFPRGVEAIKVCCHLFRSRNEQFANKFLNKFPPNLNRLLRTYLTIENFKCELDQTCLSFWCKLPPKCSFIRSKFIKVSINQKIGYNIFPDLVAREFYTVPPPTLLYQIKCWPVTLSYFWTAASVTRCCSKKVAQIFPKVA